MWFQVDSNGVGELELERYYVTDNSIFLSLRKLSSEIHAILFLIIATNIFFLVRFMFQYYVLKPFAQSIRMRKQNRARFLENGWYSIYYITFFSFGFYVYMQEPWSLIPTMNIWLGWPIQPFYTLFRVYYLLELSFYLHCIIALSFETRRKDFHQMFTHHIATFFLVGASYWYRYHRIGLAILLIHNTSDIFLYSAKALNYVEKETKSKKLQHVATALFVIFALSFLCTRLILFPFTLVRSTLIEAYFVSVNYPLFYPANVALLTLLLLHIFWFYLILRIIIRKFAGHKIDDIRSDSEEEEESTDVKGGLEADKSTIRKRKEKITGSPKAPINTGKSKKETKKTN
ncbi:ceramide synthase [Tieghemostelium lacteum]|uniref:Ceramide synthase n=1 Tax=Tieghemostelium lacteum TaxID=361077 RepID=A0A152A0I2_TIELA|nr:ceramide synthase [Tieghemostelium lacteum]|eukprot:KYQ99747.1 ceramide synthase [Tieghemostelium lacteum]